jgi:hypothetical protein
VIYTVHVARRAVEWPPQVAVAATRSAAQAAARAAAEAFPSADPKAEVRLHGCLLDCYGRPRPGLEIRHVYEAKQRAPAQKEMPLP